MPSAADIRYAIWGLIFLFFSIGSMSRRRHDSEIYLIWYINSLFFILFYGMRVIAEQKDVRLTEVCGAYEETCKSIYAYLTNVEDELTLIAIVAALALGPQLLTYVLSGLSGSASTPRFVSQVARIAVWSFVKFAAGLGGILISEPFAKLTVGIAVTFHDFLAGFRYTAISFFYAAVYIAATERLPTYLREELKGIPLQVLVTIHRFFTRNTRDQ